MAMTTFREPNKVLWVGTRPGHNGTQVLGQGGAEDETVVLYTVPADSVFYWCSYSFNAHRTGNVGTVKLEIRDDEDANVWSCCRYVFTANHIGAHMSNAFWPPIEVPAGYDIAITSPAATIFVKASIHGWVEAA